MKEIMENGDFYVPKLQKASFHHAKDILLACDMMSFGA
jgi:hypothetical protein